MIYATRLYTPFETKTSDFFGRDSGGLQVIGIGTVELPIDPPPGFVGEDPPRILRLTTVLHAPSSVCNIIGRPITKDHKIQFESESTKGFVTDRDGRNVAYFDPSRPLHQVKLRNPPSGYYALSHMRTYAIFALWSDDERVKWHAHQNTLGWSYNLLEKMWLHKYYGNEFSFLRDQGLNIYKNEDREKGKAILRSLIQADGEASVARKRRKLH